MTATWKINQYTITVNNGTGGGKYNYGTSVTIKGTVPAAGYVWEDIGGAATCTGTSANRCNGSVYRSACKKSYAWSKWSDGNTSQSRTITVTGNATYTAQFTTAGTGIQSTCSPIYATSGSSCQFRDVPALTC